MLSRIEKKPGGPEYPLSDSADYLYYKYILESIYEAVFKHCTNTLRDGKPLEDSPFNLKILQDMTGIEAELLLKVLLNEKMITIRKRNNRYLKEKLIV